MEELSEWYFELIRDAAAFKEHWVIMNNLNGELFPDVMSPSDWDEQFVIFRETYGDKGSN